MPSLTVNIEPVIIDWILSQNNISNIETNMIDNLVKWKVGEKTPTFNQIENISKKTNIPLGYFFLKTPPSESIEILNYRTIDSIELHNSSRNLIDTIDEMRNIQEWMRDYLIFQGFETLGFVGADRNETDVISIAKHIRESLKIKQDWFTEVASPYEAFRKIRYLMGENGILVMMNGIVGKNTHRKLDINEFRAFTLIDKYAPLIFINTNDSQNGKLFSLLHEATHIWLGIDSFFNDRYGKGNGVSEIEKICNAVAAEILVPEKLFLNDWSTCEIINKEEKISKLAKRFKCGNIVVARRALDNGRITKECYGRIVDDAIYEYNAQKEKKSGGGDYYNNMSARLDKRFLKALDNSMREGRTLFTDAYRLTNTNRNTFTELIKRKVD